ncbi:glycosyltransferase family 8 protein [Halenospora varia]|nr:glycosyltransferase family 8 protein [Halenospora varia]
MPKLHKRRISNPPQPQDDGFVPDFLENSPFLPLDSEDFKPDVQHHAQPVPPPSLKQVLKSRKVRNLVSVIVFLSIAFCLIWQIQKRQIIGKLGLNGPKCLYDPPLIPLTHDEAILNTVDWTPYAYATYATDIEYLCNAVMLFESISKFESPSPAGRILMYAENWRVEGQGKAGELLRKARDEFWVELVPVKVQHKTLNYPKWQDSYTKLLAFNQTKYSRLLILDSDATILQPMDELFLLQSDAPVIAPRAYWLPHPLLTSHIVLVQPSSNTFAQVQQAIAKAGDGTYDMEIVNRLFSSSCSVFPHRHYALLTGEFRKPRNGHYPYLNKGEIWDPEKEIWEAKYIHFSDYPLPKPWEEITEKMVGENEPKCSEGGKERNGREDCGDRDVWRKVYRSFRERRKVSVTPC